MAKETFYFSHDYNARNDFKIKRLLAAHGMTGYGIYWALVEELYNNANALPTEYELFATEFRCSSDMLKSVITGFDLFVISNNTLSSNSVQRRLDAREEKSAKARESAAARWGNNANGMRSHSEGNAIKESKGKETKGKNSSKFVPPTLQEFTNYFKENSYDTTVAERAWKGYEEAKWHKANGERVLNWKQTCQNVWFKPENKVQQRMSHKHGELINQ